VNVTELQELESRWVMQTYARMPVEFVRGEGARLWDSDGKRYLDFLAGISVCSVGHCHPAVVEAVRRQVGKLTHTSNLYLTEGGVRLAERLCESSLGGKAFLCNSGTEANECAIKLVRKHAHARGVSKPEVVVLEGAFHGRTMGSLSATPGLTIKDSFAPYLSGFAPVPRDNVEALRAAVGDRTAAVMLEPIQGESGVHPIADDVLIAAREACGQAGALLVFDEIQTGMGRTGTLWAHEQGPVAPDVMTAAKALGGGLPVGACVTAPVVGEGLTLGEHGSTFAGGPICARAALAALDVIADPAVLANVGERETQLRDQLGSDPAVAGIRGRGLMIGIALAAGVDAGAVAAEALARGVVVNAPNPETIRLLPPLTIDAADLGEGLARLRGALDAAG